MVTSILGGLVSVGIPLLKYIVSSINKKKVSDKEFVAYILAVQSKKQNSGQSALDFEKALDKAFNELDQNT